MTGTDLRAARIGKIERLMTDAMPRLLELCSGCGGLSLGFRTAGFDLTAHVEVDAGAAASYALNFAPENASIAWKAARDMETCTPADLVRELDLKDEPHRAFDVMAAGLPCQAFARIGRSKLREVAQDDEAYRNDPRAALYRRFLAYVRETQPLAIVIENVPDILNFGGHNVPEEICGTLIELGYVPSYTILNATWHGVPQVRERLFLIAVAEELEVTPTFPHPSHFLALPKGYESSRSVALKYVSKTSKWFSRLTTPAADLPLGVSVKEALGDLPVIHEHETAAPSMRRRALGDMLPYRRGAPSVYARQMRQWPGFATEGGCNGHLVRLTPRDFPIFRALPAGADYPAALALARKMFAEEIARRASRKRTLGRAEYDALESQMVPPYPEDKFPNKWWKMEAERPSRTLTAHVGKDTYSHIHWDSEQARTISVREAARLQSFPDGFQFAGRMNAAFRQIGNAVPPLLALAIGQTLLNQLRQAAAAWRPRRRQRVA